MTFDPFAPFNWKLGHGRQIELGPRAVIMGVLNVTPDSFSDGGRYQRPDAAIRRARRMVREGAEIIDIGGESSRPGFEEISAAEEQDRILPVFEALSGSGVLLSVDTWRAKTAELAVRAGAHIINDIWGFQRDPELAGVAAGLSAGGAMAAVLGATWPDLFAAVGVHSGLAHGSASDVVSAFAAMRGEAAPPREDTSPASADVIVFHGSADRTVHPSNAARVAGTAGRPAHRSSGVAPGGRRYERLVTEPSGTGPRVECWMVEGAGHAWSGGRPEGSYTDATGPDASAEMVRFFLDRPKRGAAR